ncbi:hypothetical protein G5I_11566 [Acromyrmex echinatior]|uniref:Uncharacterized protein n=1 Tax=Acromyrmex echinatior TaxID=103372 RepID=F4WZY8_ACREC|nr:hypothetical protein G5I_11566 [Acromyrmex echinatior]
MAKFLVFPAWRFVATSHAGFDKWPKDFQCGKTILDFLVLLCSPSGVGDCTPCAFDSLMDKQYTNLRRKEADQVESLASILEIRLGIGLLSDSCETFPEE